MPVLVWLNTDRFRPRMVECQPRLCVWPDAIIPIFISSVSYALDSTLANRAVPLRYWQSDSRTSDAVLSPLRAAQKGNVPSNFTPSLMVVSETVATVCGGIRDCGYCLWWYQRLWLLSVVVSETVDTRDCGYCLWWYQRLWLLSVVLEIVATVCGSIRDCGYCLWWYQRLWLPSVVVSETVATVCGGIRDCGYCLWY